MFSSSRLPHKYGNNDVLEELRLITDKYRSINDDGFRNKTFNKLRNILRTELKKHENDADYKTFDIGYIQGSSTHAYHSLSPLDSGCQ